MGSFRFQEGNCPYCGTPLGLIEKNKSSAVAKGPKKLQTLKNRLAKNAHTLWTFLDHLNVPPDNNGAERAIRNVKVKQKVSGQFRSEKGAAQFAIIRSVYDTIRKNNGKAFDALSLVANYVPE